jgi:hypothetical protein
MVRKGNASQFVATWNADLGISRAIRRISCLGNVCSRATNKLFWVSGEDQSEDLTHLRKSPHAGVVASMNLAVFYLGISRNPATPESRPQTPRATEGLKFGCVSLAGAANQDF